MTLKKSIQVPASTTNLGAGFDVLGLALQLYLRVELRQTGNSRPEFQLFGEGAGELPANEENLLWKVMNRVFDGEKQTLPGVHLRIDNQIPIARGLGSSAAAIVAGVSCFEALTGRELPSERFFQYAFEFEDHPDNITAGRFGGFTVSAVHENGKVTFFQAPITPRLKILLTVPEFQLETQKARSVIPRTLDLCDAIFNLQRSSLTVAALLKNEFHFLRETLRDKIHQPFRAPLIPGLEEILRLNQADIPGLAGICLSGAGPSVLAFAEQNLDDIYRRVAAIFERHGIRSRRFELEVDNQGRTIH
ncbi:MAG: homoserine kinase [Acidobacteria bacterium]|nr:homoserine kinase [Acidobacteriota bacterium]MCI0720709.1 homoserine kinase [Acidobacteriota bacterium]